MATNVEAADGSRWVVRRRWTDRQVPWRGRSSVTEKAGHLLDAGSMVDDLDLGPIAAIFLVVAVLLVVVFFVIPGIVFVVELLLAALVVLGGLGVKVLLRRPWTVEARCEDDVRRWPVVGWRASGRAVDHVATHIRRTGSPPETTS